MEISPITSLTSKPTLAAHCVDLYLITPTTRINTGLLNYLSPEEVERTNYYKVEWKARQYWRSKIILREILSHYCQMPAEEITYEFNRYGKPFLPATINPHQLQFNVSHSKEYSVIAICTETIGIDIENKHRDIDAPEFAKRHYHENEIAHFEQNGADLPCFYEIFTRKEAILKAIGRGLIDDLASFDCSLDKVELSKILHHQQHWDLQTLSLPDDLVCSIATQHKLAKIQAYLIEEL